MEHPSDKRGSTEMSATKESQNNNNPLLTADDSSRIPSVKTKHLRNINKKATF